MGKDPDRLWDEFHRSHDPGVRERLYRHYKPLVWGVVERARPPHPWPLGLIHMMTLSGIAALQDALDSWVGRDKSFRTITTLRIERSVGRAGIACRVDGETLEDKERRDAHILRATHSMARSER